MANLINIKTVVQLHEFVKKIKILIELVKCPVCLEITKTPVRIACDHVFCTKCLDTFINTFKDQAPNKVPQCPICRKAIKKLRNPINSYVESLLTFLCDIDSSVQSTIGCSVLALSNIKDIKKLSKDQILKDNESSIVESTSYQENAFDKLLNSGIQNPLFKGKYGKNYTRKSGKKEANQKWNELKTFESSDTKTKIQQWLENTKNHFDQLTQTQRMPNEAIPTQSSISISSASQIKNEMVREKRLMKRPKSFEVKPKMPVVRLKRYSICGESQKLVDVVTVNEMQSEDINMPNNDVLRLLEEECLNNIELELGVEPIPEQEKLKELKLNNSDVDKNSWQRMKKMNKTINNNTKRRKNELNVIITSPTEKENIEIKIIKKRKSRHTAKNESAKNPAVVLDRFESDTEYCNFKGNVITKNKRKDTHVKEKYQNNSEIFDHAISNVQELNKTSENSDADDFICSATRLSKKVHKLSSSSIYTEDQCSIQCSKDSDHEVCGISSIAISKFKNLSCIVSKAELAVNKLKLAMQDQHEDIPLCSFKKLNTIMNDLSDVLNRSYNKHVTAMASTQTSYDMKSVYIQTEVQKPTKNKTDNKTLRSVDVQTEDMVCDACEDIVCRLNEIKSQSVKNSTLTGTDIILNSEQIREFSKEVDFNDFLVKTQEITEKNAPPILTIRSPLQPTQKLDNTNRNTSNKASISDVNTKTKNILSPNVDEEITTFNTSAKKLSLNSQLLFTISNPKINSREECEKRIAQVSTRYKRIRPLELESDEESFTKKAKIENKYLAQDLSIEMISENIACDDSKLKTRSNSSLSLNNCKDVDYDAYLVNIMKKYEEKSNSVQKQTKKTESQTILDRCDAMIKEVTSMKPTTKDQTPQKNEHVSNNNAVIEANKEIDDNENHIEDITIRESPVDLEMLQEFNEPFDPLNATQSRSLPCTESLMANIDIEELEANTTELRSELYSTVKDVSLSSKPSTKNNTVLLKKDSKVIILNHVLLSDGENPKLHENNDNGSVKSEELFNSENDELIDADVIETTPKKQSQVIHRSFSSQLKRRCLLKTLPPLVDSPDVISSIDHTSFLDQTFTPPANFQDGFNGANEIDVDVTNNEDFDATVVATNVTNTQLDNVLVKSKSTNENDNKSVIDLDLINSKDFDITMFTLDAANKNLNHDLDENKCKEKTQNEDKMGLSITESELLRLINTDKSCNLITSTQKPLANTNFETLGISPICKPKRKNPIEIAQSTKFSPLDIISVTKPETSKQRLTTSLATKQKSILSFVKSDKIDKNESIISIGSSNLSPSPSTKPFVSCTRLNKQQMVLVSSLSNKKLIRYTNNYSPLLTHIIVSVNKQNYLLDHTMKLLMAIAHGKWVLNLDWVKDCLAQNRIVPEEKYEALDMSGLPGPKISRLSRKEKPLLRGYKIYLEPPFLSTTVEDIEKLITALNGEIVPDIETLSLHKGIRLIITEAKSSQDYYKCEEWKEVYNIVTVDIEWLSRSIGQYHVVSLRPFALCSDNNINNMGYPPELTVESSFSCSQNVITTNR